LKSKKKVCLLKKFFGIKKLKNLIKYFIFFEYLLFSQDFLNIIQYSNKDGSV